MKPLSVCFAAEILQFTGCYDACEPEVYSECGSCIAQSQKAVTAYSTSQQLLPFGFAEQNSWPCGQPSAILAVKDKPSGQLSLLLTTRHVTDEAFNRDRAAVQRQPPITAYFSSLSLHYRTGKN